jgi:hypothetical protein
LYLRAVGSCLRAHSPGAGRAARLGSVAFIHRFGSTLNAHLHFHCVVIDGVFDSATSGAVNFHAATGFYAHAIAQVQARRRRLRTFVRRGLLPTEDAQAMAQWEHGGGFSVDASVRIEAADRAVVSGSLLLTPLGVDRSDRRPGAAAANPPSPALRCAGANGRSPEMSAATLNGRSWVSDRRVGT